MRLVNFDMLIGKVKNLVVIEDIIILPNNLVYNLSLILCLTVTMLRLVQLSNGLLFKQLPEYWTYLFVIRMVQLYQCRSLERRTLNWVVDFKKI